MTQNPWKNGRKVLQKIEKRNLKKPFKSARNKSKKK